MMTQQFLYNLTQDSQRMQTAQVQMSTGKVLNQPSDNPLAVSQDMAINATLSQITSYQSSITAGLTWLQNSSSAVQSMITQLQNIQGVVIQGLNATSSSPSGNAALSQTAKQLAQSVNQALDSKQGNRYLFGGTATGTAPSSYAGYGGTPASTPTGAPQSIAYTVATGVQINVNTTASAMFLSTAAGASSDLQGTLQSVVTDLASGNHAALSQDLTNLNANLNQVVNINADLGTHVQRMTAAQNLMSQYSQRMTTQKGVIVDANMAKVITQFNTDQTVFQAALKMGAGILLPSLVSYLPNG